MPSRVRIVLLALAASCGPADEPPPAEFAALCGQTGPVRVLELPPGELLTGSSAIGERALLYTARVDAPDVAGSLPRIEAHTLWSVGRCGEAPVRVDPAAGTVLEVARWPGLALGWRKQAGEIAALDLTGETASHVAFTGVGAGGGDWTEHGLVSYEDAGEQAMNVLLHAYPGDPRRDTVTGGVLIESVRHGARVVGDELFVRDREDALLRVTLPAGEVHHEADDVESFALSSDGRWLLRQSPVGVPESLRPRGAVILRDRETGVETDLGIASLRAALGPFVGADLLAINDESDDLSDGVMRVYSLPGLEFVELPPRRALFGAVSDGRWLIGTWGEWTLDLFDPQTASVSPLVTRGRLMWLGDEEIAVLDVQEHRVPDAHLDEEGPIYRVAFTGAAQRVADRATVFSRRLDDGRWLTGLDLDERLVGQLVLIDPDGDTTLVDDRVYASSMQRTRAFGGEDALVYSVDDGARTGVWLARLGGG